MFKVNAGTTIQVYAPFGKAGEPRTVTKGGTTYIDHAPWKPYVTKEDKIYEKEEVLDAVTMFYRPDDVPLWAQRNIQLGNVVITRDGAFAMCKPTQITYLD